jgi:hypothetical protein
MTQEPDRDELTEQLWVIFKENSGSELFTLLREKLSLPAPEERLRLSDQSQRDEAIPEGTALNEQLGLIIDSNPERFKPLNLSEPVNGYTFNPTELTARFTAFFLNDIRDTLCGQPGGLTLPGDKIVKRVTGAVAISVSFATHVELVAISALMLLIVLKATRGSLCQMTDMQVIHHLVDPNSAFEKSAAGRWVLKNNMTASKRPFVILVGTVIVALGLVAFIVSNLALV